MGFFTTVFIYFIILAILLLILLFWPESGNSVAAKSAESQTPKIQNTENQNIKNQDQFKERSANIDVNAASDNQNPKQDDDVKQEDEVVSKNVSFEEFPEQSLEDDAPEEVKKKYTWNHNVRKITKTINSVSNGNLKAINFCYVDRLINVRGKNRPIAFFLRPLSSELSPSGVFIYDTTRILKDNALYLFVGPEADEYLEGLGEKLLNLMIESTKCPNIIRIKRDMDCPDFQRMIHQMGGNKNMMQTSKNYGDQYFYEIQFFKNLLHITVFDGEMMSSQENLDFDKLPPNCAVVIDTSDNALYLYVDHVDPSTEEEKNTQLQAIQWMSEQPEYSNKELLVFDKSTIPPNLKLLFCKDPENH